MKRILSFGGGVNTTALMVLIGRGDVHADAAVFADTQGEWPETYTYITEIAEPYLRSINLPFHRVTAGSLYDDHHKKRIIPYVAFRSCTDKFKVRPIRQWVRDELDGVATLLLGIDAGETRRIKTSSASADISFEYPLVELGIDRAGCVKVIQDAGLPVPPKSGCYFCPFQNRAGYTELLKVHPDLYAKAEELEKNHSRFPAETLRPGTRLDWLRRGIEQQKTLDDFGGSCGFCEVSGCAEEVEP